MSFIQNATSSYSFDFEELLNQLIEVYSSDFPYLAKLALPQALADQTVAERSTQLIEYFIAITVQAAWPWIIVSGQQRRRHGFEFSINADQDVLSTSFQINTQLLDLSFDPDLGYQFFLTIGRQEPYDLFRPIELEWEAEQEDNTLV